MFDRSLDGSRGAGRTAFLFAAVLFVALALVLAAGGAAASPCPSCPDGGGDGDTTAPTVTGVSPAAGATNVPESNNVTATFSEAMDGITITDSTFTLVRNGTTTPVSAEVSYDPASKTATLNPAANLAPLETYTATVTTDAKDMAGNALDQDPNTVGEQPKTWSFRVGDTTPPNVSLTSPASGAVVKGNVFLGAAASDTSGAISGVEFRVRGVLVDWDSTAPYVAYFDTRSMPDGAATIRATAFDAAGNSAFAEAAITIDNTAPTLTITGGPDGQTFGAGSTQTWTFSAADPASGITSVQCSVVPTNSAPSFGSCSGDNNSHGVTDKPDGNYTFTVKARDNAGHETTRSRAFAIDATPPQTTITSGIADGAVTSQTTFTWDFSSSESGSTFECRVYSAALTPPAFDTCSGDGSHTASSFSPGTYNFEVRSRDAFGNLDSTPSKRTWTINAPPPDTTAPTLDTSSLMPLKGATSVPRNTAVSATFSEAMKPSTLNTTSFKLQQYNNGARKWKTIPATVTLSNGDTTVTLDAFGATEGSGEQLLAGNRKFRGFITTAAQDTSGNPLASKFVWTFTTGGS